MEEHDLIRDMLTREPSFEPLKRLPGQPESNDYFEVLDARPIPDGFFGYVGEYSGERFEDGAKSIRAVALVKRNGDVWPVEGLVEEIPEGDRRLPSRARR